MRGRTNSLRVTKHDLKRSTSIWNAHRLKKLAIICSAFEIIYFFGITPKNLGRPGVLEFLEGAQHIHQIALFRDSGRVYIGTALH
jgi:hypothetical protein